MPRVSYYAADYLSRDRLLAWLRKQGEADAEMLRAKFGNRAVIAVNRLARDGLVERVRIGTYRAMP